MVKKKNAKKRTAKKVVHKKKAVKENTPDYMVQIAEPKIVRKDILESLREVIIFMQGYEKFRKIQEDKVSLFSSLRFQIKELRSLINDNLRKKMPQGKLKGINPESPIEVNQRTVDKSELEVANVNKKSISAASSDLTELESQLRDIENQLQRV